MRFLLDQTSYNLSSIPKIFLDQSLGQEYSHEVYNKIYPLSYPSAPLRSRQ